MAQYFLRLVKVRTMKEFGNGGPVTACRSPSAECAYTAVAEVSSGLAGVWHGHLGQPRKSKEVKITCAAGHLHTRL